MENPFGTPWGAPGGASWGREGKPMPDMSTAKAKTHDIRPFDDIFDSLLQIFIIYQKIRPRKGPSQQPDEQTRVVAIGIGPKNLLKIKILAAFSVHQERRKLLFCDKKQTARRGPRCLIEKSKQFEAKKGDLRSKKRLIYLPIYFE